jgi:hypothetical protein
VFGTLHPIGLIAVALASRAVLLSSVEYSFGLQRQALSLLVLHDVISFAVFVCSFFGQSVECRSSIYRILNDGTIGDDGSAINGQPGAWAPLLVTMPIV